MLAREVNGSLAHSLIAAELGILANAPAGVTALKKGVPCRVAQCCPATIMGADTWEYTLQLLQTVLGIVLNFHGIFDCGIGCRGRIRGSRLPACIIDE